MLCMALGVPDLAGSGQRTVTGTVVSAENGESLAGCHRIAVKGTSLGHHLRVPTVILFKSDVPQDGECAAVQFCRSSDPGGGAREQHRG
jgi:hypothetical protein